MLLTGILLFVLCLVLSAFFSSSETAFMAVNPYSLEYHERKGSKRAALARKIVARTNDLLATILIGNTLVNAAAASIATSVFAAILPPEHRSRAVLYATAATTVLLLVFGEINPKTFAAHNSVRMASLLAYPIKGAMFLLAPVAKLFSFVTGLIMPSSKAGRDASFRSLNEEETRIALHAGARGLSTLRRRIVSGALEIGTRPIKEVMVPRPEIRAIEIDSRLEDVLNTVRSAGYSRYPVYKGRLDSIEGIIHGKDIIGYLIDNKSFVITDILRKAFFVPEFASLETVLLQMQEKAVHMALVVDEFGNVDGLVTLEDIIEEIVGEIRDEYDEKAEEWFQLQGKNAYLVKGNASIKELCQRLPLCLPQTGEFTTLAGFLLFRFGKIPHEKDALEFEGNRFLVEKMNKRHISLVRITLHPADLEQRP